MYIETSSLRSNTIMCAQDPIPFSFSCPTPLDTDINPNKFSAMGQDGVVRVTLGNLAKKTKGFKPYGHDSNDALILASMKELVCFR